MCRVDDNRMLPDLENRWKTAPIDIKTTLNIDYHYAMKTPDMIQESISIPVVVRGFIGEIRLMRTGFCWYIFLIFDRIPSIVLDMWLEDDQDEGAQSDNIATPWVRPCLIGVTIPWYSHSRAGMREPICCCLVLVFEGIPPMVLDI
jgi:hypothetical protein